MQFGLQSVIYITSMGRKPKQYKYVKENDGRRNNGRKPGVRNVPVVRPTSSAAINNAKRNRVGIYALNAMSKVFGSEEEAWESLAEQAKEKALFRAQRKAVEAGAHGTLGSEQQRRGKGNCHHQVSPWCRAHP